MGTSPEKEKKEANPKFKFYDISLDLYLNNTFGYYYLGNNNSYDKTKILWLDPKVNNIENSNYQKKLRNINVFTLKVYTDIGKCIEDLINIHFEKTVIIVSGSYSIEFFTQLESKINELLVIPKIIIFTSYKRFVKIKNHILNLDKYDLFDINLVFDNFPPILDELKIKNENIYQNNYNYNYNNENINQKSNYFSFEYIEEKKQLVFPLYLTDFLDIPNLNEINDFNNFLLKRFSYENGTETDIKELISQLLIKTKIPLQILVKYWLRAYTTETKFYKNMNNYLVERLGNQYDIYIKVLYHGLKQNYIIPCIDKELYRGALITKDELNYINNSLKNKKKNLPGCICYCKSFLSTSISKKIAENFLRSKVNKKSVNEELVLYQIQSSKDSNNFTNVDIQNFSAFDEKEILFFPFSCFEINNVQILQNNIFGKYFNINLVYLGKYKKEVKKTEKISKSNYVKDIFSTTIIDKIEMEKDPTQFEFDIKDFIPPELKMGYIIATYEIKNIDLDKNIQILNCEITNKKEIQDICEIYNEGKKLDFSFTYCFTHPAKYKFKILFKKLLKDASKLFYGCESLISLDLKNFKTNYVRSMDDMFNGCKNLKDLDLSSFKTKDVTSMKNMFYNCKSLKNIELSELNTINVTNMNSMFGNCASLTLLNLSKFNTKNVVDMSKMFKGCSSLIFMNLTSFNTAKVKNMFNMFHGCSSLPSLNISSFKITRSTTTINMFSECTSLNTLYVSKDFEDKSIGMNKMFNNSTPLPNILFEYQMEKAYDRRYSAISTKETYKEYKRKKSFFNIFHNKHK